MLTPYTSHFPYLTLPFHPLPLPLLLPPFFFFKAFLQNRDQIVQSSYPQARMGMLTQGGVFVGVGEEKNGGGAGTEAGGHIVKRVADLLVGYERETVTKGG